MAGAGRAPLETERGQELVCPRDVQGVALLGSTPVDEGLASEGVGRQEGSRHPLCPALIGGKRREGRSLAGWAGLCHRSSGRGFCGPGSEASRTPQTHSVSSARGCQPVTCCPRALGPTRHGFLVPLPWQASICGWSCGCPGGGVFCFPEDWPSHRRVCCRCRALAPAALPWKGLLFPGAVGGSCVAAGSH